MLSKVAADAPPRSLGANVTSHFATGPAFAIDRKLFVGGVALMGAGGLLWVTGAAASAAALGVALRRWVEQTQSSPSGRVGQRWAQLRATGAAGADAWRTNGTHGVPSQ
jgi:hypothetical protein